MILFPGAVFWAHGAILQVQIVELDEAQGKIVLKAQIDHPYPTTKIMFMPETVRPCAPGRRLMRCAQGKPQTDLFATTGDYLRLWKIADDGKSAEMECVLNDVCPPLLTCTLR